MIRLIKLSKDFPSPDEESIKTGHKATIICPAPGITHKEMRDLAQFFPEGTQMFPWLDMSENETAHLVYEESPEGIFVTSRESVILAYERMIRREKLTCEDVIMNCVSKDKDGYYICHIHFAEHGGFRNPWPGGFHCWRSDMLMG